MKTISPELSKKFNELWILKSIKTEYIYLYDKEYDEYILSSKVNKLGFWDIKTLTLDEINKYILPNLNESAREYINNELSKSLRDSLSVLEIADIDFFENVLDYLLDNNFLKIK